MTLRTAPWLALPLAIACSSVTTPDPVDVAPIQVDRVRVSVSGPEPASVSVHVEGVVGDGCAVLLPERQSRSGHRIVVTIERERPVDAICTQVALLYDRVLPLDGRFAAGNYSLLVNDVESRFVVPRAPAARAKHRSRIG